MKKKNTHLQSNPNKKPSAISSNEVEREGAASAPNEESDDISRSRRSFLGKVTAAALAASVLGLPRLGRGQDAQPELIQPLPPEDEYMTTSCTTGCDIELQTPVQRANTALARRVKAAILERTAGIPPHPCNGDETLYRNQNYIGSYTKGLRKINNFGDVDPVAYCSLLTAIRTSNP
ncbi:MAG: twin-arginine translocation signal domain-containing protein, partial [Acidobacteria bacterium]|nr:twin-arginine translocation signal domain-containing protein [Acidobacteriota bacterium]